MLDALRFENVGPAAKLALEFKPRMNFLVGDNGLGKSFVLDAAWWALTQTWARRMLRPHAAPSLPEIGYRYSTSEDEHLSRFDRKRERWQTDHSHPPLTELVIYAQVDGGFSVRDPARNYLEELPGRPAAYLFEPRQLWEGNSECEGLIRDWASWQREGSIYFDSLTRVLDALSPGEDEPLVPGELRRLSLDDPKYYPTLATPYGEDVIVVHASAGMRRIIALAYLLVWAWHEHLAACQLLGSEPTRQLVLLVDELESHLHPQWQRRIVPALLRVMEAMSETREVEIQLIAATHSPLALASTESQFDPKRDVIWAFDLVDGAVELEVSTWRRHGDANNWLSSPLFDLGAPRSLESERALKRAKELVVAYRQAQQPAAEPEWLQRMHEQHEQERRRADEERSEREANNLRVLNENLERIRSGEHRNLLAWLTIVGADSGSRLTFDLDKLRARFGDEIAAAARAGLLLAWRAHRAPFYFEQESRQTITGEVRIGLAGLQLAFEAELDANELDANEVELAARYAVHELNGFPSWFEALCQAHPQQVVEALEPAIEADLHLDAATDTPEVLGWLPGIPEVLRRPFAAATLDILARTTPSHAYALQNALEACAWLDAPAQLRTVCERQTWAARDTELATIWWCGWLRVEPNAALAYLEEFALDAPADELDEVIEQIATQLGTFPGGTKELGALATDIASLEKLIRLVHRSIRAEDDTPEDVTGAAHFVTDRDRAEGFRHGLGEQLASSPDPEAAAALDRLAVDPSMQAHRWWSLERAWRIRQRSPAAQPKSPEQTYEWLAKLDASSNETPSAPPLLAPVHPAGTGEFELPHLFDIEIKVEGKALESSWEQFMRKRSGLSWEQLLEHRWVALQSSKEHLNLRAWSARLRSDAKITAYFDIPALARDGVEKSLPLVELASLKRWREQEDGEATFFLDWHTEPPSDSLLPAALDMIEDYVDDAHPRLRVLVNLGPDPRPDDKHAFADFVWLPPIERSEPTPVADLNGESSSTSIDTLKRREHTSAEWILARPGGFDHAELHRAIERRLGDRAAAFIDAVEFADAWELLPTHAALDDALERWREHGTLGTRAQLLEHETSLLLSRARRGDLGSTASSWAQLCAGFGRLCAATVVSAKHSILVPGQPGQAEHLAPLTILAGWERAEVEDLLERQIFEPVLEDESQVQVMLPSARPYLGAKWLSAQGRASSLHELTFVVIGGKTIVPDHLAPLLAWACLEDTTLLARTIEVEPTILLRFGDQERLTKRARIAALDAYLTRIDRYDIWRGVFGHNALRRFAVGLDAQVETRLTRKDLSPDARELLLALVAAGELRGCIDHALETARDLGADTYLRRRAYKAVRALADVERQRQFVAEAIEGEPNWDQDLAGELAQLFFPSPLDRGLLADLMRRAQPRSPTHSTALRTFLHYNFDERCTESELLPTLEWCARLVPDLTQDLAGTLRDTMRALIIRALQSLDPAEDPPEPLTLALAQIEKDAWGSPTRSHEGLEQALSSKPRVQRWLFWHRLDNHVEQYGWPSSEREGPGRSELSPAAARGWLAEDARTHGSPERREYAFRTLLALARKHPELTELSAELASEDPRLGEIAFASLPPDQRWLERARAVDEALRASLGDIDPFWLRWRAFMSELGESP